MNQDIGVILPAHGSVHYNGKKLLKKYKDHRLARLDLILKAFQSFNNQATVEQLTDQAYQDVAKEYHQYAQLQVKTYLKMLEDEDKVESKGEKFQYLGS